MTSKKHLLKPNELSRAVGRALRVPLSAPRRPPACTALPFTFRKNGRVMA